MSLPEYFVSRDGPGCRFTCFVYTRGGTKVYKGLYRDLKTCLNRIVGPVHYKLVSPKGIYWETNVPRLRLVYGRSVTRTNPYSSFITARNKWHLFHKILTVPGAPESYTLIKTWRRLPETYMRELETLTIPVDCG